jgi:hypothetical protein
MVRLNCAEGGDLLRTVVKKNAEFTCVERYIVHVLGTRTAGRGLLDYLL